MKRVTLFGLASLFLALASALSGCGQTGPLFMPTPAQRGEVPVRIPGGSPPSSLIRSQDDAQMQQPTPSSMEPRPGTR